MDINNLTSVYNSNPTLQGQYSLQQYLDLFGGGSTGTTTPPTTGNPISTPIQPNQGIINQNINKFQGGGGGEGIISERGSQQRINDFNSATAARQERLNNPGKIQSFVNSMKEKIGIDPQMSVEQMLSRSGYMDPQKRRTGGIPFGIGSAIAMTLPDKYYDMSLEDQIFTQSQMGYNDGSGYKDEFGYNTRSALGNYGEFVGERVDKTGTALEKSAKNFSAKNPNLGTVSFDKVTGKITGDEDAIDAWNRKTAYIQKEFFSFTDKAKKRTVISDRVVKEKKEQDARIMKEEKANRERAKQQQALNDAYNAQTQASRNRQDQAGGSGGGQFDGAASKRSYSAEPTAYSGSFKKGGSVRKYFKGGIVSLRGR